MLEDLEFFSQIVVSIVLEAAPFLLLGALASGFVESFATRDKVERLSPRGAVAGSLFGVVLGLALPCCECGIVFVARRLLSKGMPPAAAIAFMLAGPVVNPVVLAGTYVAFLGDVQMMLWRAGLVALIAFIAGLIAHRFGVDGLLLPASGPEPACACGCGGDNPEVPAGLLLAPKDKLEIASLEPGLRRKIEAALSHCASDFLEMAKILLLGAVIAAAFKSFVPQEYVRLFEDDLLLSILAMMFMAVLLSLCSQADAFVAASFTGVPFAAKLAFLALGPVLDVKLAVMWQMVFKPRFVRVLILLPAALVFLVCLLLGRFGWVLL